MMIRMHSVSRRRRLFCDVGFSRIPRIPGSAERYYFTRYIPNTEMM